MKDNFEKHIIKNKESFDVYKADKDKIWAQVESKLEASKAPAKIIFLSRKKIINVAASIIILLGLFALGSNNYETRLSAESKELNDIDIHYIGLVNHQANLIKNSSKLTGEEKKEFFQFTDELDFEYQKLKEELDGDINSETVLEAIITNYKKRIELMENLLKRINKPKKIGYDDGYIL
tara:strand:- start:107709 stop:108245 length:537 start_codon:yes stop_codon:yes gene_type:complete